MKYLLDTNAFISLLGNPQLLSPKYRLLLVAAKNEFVLSPGRIGQGIRLLPSKQNHLRAIARLLKVAGHGNPFDFLIIAQA